MMNYAARLATQDCFSMMGDVLDDSESETLALRHGERKKVATYFVTACCSAPDGGQHSRDGQRGGYGWRRPSLGLGISDRRDLDCQCLFR